VRANKGAPGVDSCTIEDFEADLKGNLYKIWNRMSSGSYFPPPVLAVEILKAHGDGVRILGVSTVADRVAQTVVAARLEKVVEPKFHADSYGYRPGRSALDAVARCRERCWGNDWVIDLDIQKFLDSVPWDLGQGGRSQHRRALGRFVCEAVACRSRATTGRLASRTGPGNPSARIHRLTS
jgi:RNA-directed DNA polymerase